MKKILIAGLLLVQTLTLSAQLNRKTTVTPLTDQQKSMMEAFHLVSSEEIDTWITTFVSDEYRGRRSGDVGYDMAAQDVIDLFTEWGLTPAGDKGTYENTFAQPFNDVLGVGHLTAYYEMGGKSIAVEYEAGVEYFPTAQSDNGKVLGELYYAGYGITAPELGYNDYAGADLTGKVVLVEGGYPYKGKDLDTLKMWSKYQRIQPKVAAAKAAGAKAVLFVSRYANPFPRQEAGVVVNFVSQQTADELMSRAGKTMAECKAACEALTPQAINTNVVISTSAENKFYPKNTTANIVGMIEGSDPKLKEEYIILGAHLDHLGMLPNIHPGALDNASGSVIMMAAAKALALSGVEMKRSVVIVLFAAEELGVLGADHFIKTMPYKPSQIECMVNIDMLGEGNGLSITTADRWADLVPYFESASIDWARLPFTTVSGEWDYKTRFFTDGNAFWNLEIPTIEMRSTGGPWPVAYHVPGDDLSQVDPVFMADAVRALVIATIEIANR